MNIAISLIGVSSFLGRDYKHCFSSISKNLIEPYSKNHDVKLYLTSYKDKSNNDLVKLYNPYYSNFIDYNDSHQVLTNVIGVSSIEECDFIITTRFDIHFHKDMSDINLDFKKLNALFREKGWWKNSKFTTDNFFAFPYSMLTQYKTAVNTLYTDPPRPGMTDLHQAFYRVQKLVGEENTHIVSDIDELSNYNSFYNLCNEKWGQSE